MAGTVTEYDAIIVGAGATGIAATQTLSAQGLNVLCVEAAERTGGRTHTDTGIFGVPFDIGAHWMHTEQVNALKAPGLAMGLDLYAAPENSFTHGADQQDALWSVVERIYAKAETAMKEDKATEQRTGHPTDRSLADVMDETGPWALTARMMCCLSMARDPAEISLRDMHAWVGGGDWFCREGFGHLVIRLGEGLPIRLSCPVEAIETQADHVRVVTTQGPITARAVIVTASVGVLAEDVIRFDPPLEVERRRALDYITMSDYNHTALMFAAGTIPLEADTWLSYRIDKEVDGIPQGGGFLCNISGTGLVSFEAGGSFSRSLMEAGADASIDFALETLAGLLGSDIRKGFVKGHATAWRNEPFVRGSYSGALPGGHERRQALRAPHAERVHFAGEATHDGQSASVSGAYLEGQRAARDVIKLLK